MDGLLLTYRLRGLLLCVPLLLAGCGGGGFEDLDKFVEEVEAQPTGTIEPLPEFLPYEAFAYSAASMRSPFEPPIVVNPQRNDGKKSNIKPDPNRVKQYLEQFQIGELSMVGTIAREATLYALIQDADKGVHRVRTGDFMGTNHGKIQRVTDLGVDFVEIVSDGTGGWVERARTMTLTDE